LSSTDIKSVGKVQPNLKVHVVQKVEEHVWSTRLSTFTCINQMLAFVNWKCKGSGLWLLHCSFASFYFISFCLIFFLLFLNCFFMSAG